MKVNEILKRHNIPYCTYVLHKDGGTACPVCRSTNKSNTEHPALTFSKKLFVDFEEDTLTAYLGRCSECATYFYLIDSNGPDFYLTNKSEYPEELVHV